MKKSSFIHAVSVVDGAGGTIFGFTQQHCFYDAIVLELIFVSTGVCALYRRQLEREG